MPTSKKTVPGHQIAYQFIKTQIIHGEWPEGSAIRQDDIAATLNLSKIPVREALMRLETEGFVTFTPNIGASVTVFTPEDYLDILDIRIALECRALELAIPHLTPEIIAQAQAILDAYRHADGVTQRSEGNARFHQCLYAPSNRPRLLQMIESTQDHMGKIFRQRISELARHKRSARQHQAILDACAAGESKKAIRLLKQHIGQTQAEVLQHFRHRGYLS